MCTSFLTPRDGFNKVNFRRKEERNGRAKKMVDKHGVVLLETLYSFLVSKKITERLLTLADHKYRSDVETRLKCISD